MSAEQWAKLTAGQQAAMRELYETRNDQWNSERCLSSLRAGVELRGESLQAGETLPLSSAGLIRVRRPLLGASSYAITTRGVELVESIERPDCLDCGRPADHPYSCTFSQHGDPIHDALDPACWPRWANNEEDGDVWTLRSLGWTAEQAWAEVEPYLLLDDGFELVKVREEPMVYLPDADGPGDWRIQAAHPDEHDQVAVYVRWELAESASGGESA